MRFAKWPSCLLAVVTALAAPCAGAANDRSLDPAFDGTGYRRVAFDFGGDLRDFLQGMAREPSGNYVLVGEVAAPSAQTGLRVGVARIRRSDGGLLSSFTHDPFFDSVRGVALDVIARQVIVGTTPTNGDGRPDLGVVRYFNGAPDTTFAGDGGLSYDSPNSSNATDEPLAVTIRSNGEILVLIQERPNTSAAYPYVLVRIPDNGTGLSSLPLGGTTLGYSGGAMLLQPDGKLVVAVNIVNGAGALCEQPRLFRFAPNTLANLDASFGTAGIVTLAPPTGTGNCAPAVTAIALDAQDRILLGAVSRSASASASWVARVNATGTLDSSFNGDGWSRFERPLGGDFHDIYGIGVQRDGSIMTGGTFTFSNPTIGDRLIIGRMLPNGTPDVSFETLGSSIYTTGATATPQNGVAMMMDGDKVVLAGSWLAATPNDYDFQVIRTIGPPLRDGFE